MTTEDDRMIFMTLNKVLHNWNVNEMDIYETSVIQTSWNADAGDL